MNFSFSKAVRYDTDVTLSLCYPCHYNLDANKPAGLVFNHAVHFERGIKCISCHYRFPHLSGEIERVSVNICFGCHNLTHGPQRLLAPNDCSLCHDHIFPESEVNKVLEELKEFSPPTITFNPRILKDEYFSVELPVTMGKCVFCHSDLDANQPAGLIFTHAPHFEKGISCSSCHREYPHRKDKVGRVPMIICSACHSLNHSIQGQIAGEACSLCHTKGFNLLPKSHTNQFKQELHAKEAENDLYSCYSCHTENYCVNCHNGKVARSPKKVYPQNHAFKEVWEKQHGTDTYALKTCSPCHTTAYCDECHLTRVPHEVTFVAEHEDVGKESSYVCDQCHREQKSFCSDCHHQKIADKVLTFASCEECHPEVKLPMLQVRDKGLMVHRAHFEMTKTEPYECSECHGRIYATGQGCFSLELCKECHGKERLGKLIAKYKVDNGELCMRCHPDAGGPAGVLRF
ncbi:MAG: hypothetical protein KAS39_07425 [Actinomycetia bacterium]|nr:hypothetical protein [Actinomycetes bacterium]